MNNEKIIYGSVQLVLEILNFPTPELYLIEESKLPNKEITAIYSFKNNEIIFNENWINRSEWIEVMITVLHEMRHAYQGYCVRTKTREDAETLKRWENELNSYTMPSGKNNIIDDKNYLMQEIEIDAIAFAHWIIKKELDISTVIPDIISKEVKQKIEAFEATRVIQENL